MPRTPRWLTTWYTLRCWVGRPACWRDYQGTSDWWYARCKHCNGQSELHRR